jgi:hypothetical protein
LVQWLPGGDDFILTNKNRWSNGFLEVMTST